MLALTTKIIIENITVKQIRVLTADRCTKDRPVNKVTDPGQKLSLYFHRMVIL